MRSKLTDISIHQDPTVVDELKKDLRGQMVTSSKKTRGQMVTSSGKIHEDRWYQALEKSMRTWEQAQEKSMWTDGNEFRKNPCG